jgi:hypothetical protein
MPRNNNQSNRRLGQTETMVRNTQDERQERLNRLLGRDTRYNNQSKKKNDIVDFTEQYLGAKLEPCQKELLNQIYKTWNTQSFSPAHSYSYSYQSVVMQLLKELMKNKEDK